MQLNMKSPVGSGMLELTGALNHYTHATLSHYNGNPERL